MQASKFADFCKKNNLVCTLMPIDIKNALNTLRWETIINEAKYRKLPGNLINLLNDYLNDGGVVINGNNGIVKSKVCARIRHGSVVRPLLWNLDYNGSLDKFNNIKNLKTIASADERKHRI